MPGKYAKLRKDWLLRGWTDVPLAIANSANGFVRRLEKKSFYVAEACDGKTDFNSLAFLPEHHALLDELIEDSIAEICLENTTIEPAQRYRKSNAPQLKGIHWCVTGLCNLNCRHCYMESPAGRYGELPLTDMVRFIEQFEQANVICVSLTGGEPFLRTDILDIITILTKKKICISQIFSNALLITDEHLHGIKNLGISPGFQISFDGKGAHDTMRGTKTSEQHVIDSILRLQAAGFPVVIATSIDRLNIDHLTDTYDLMKELQIQFWRIAAPQRSGNWRDTVTALSLQEEATALRPLLERWLREGKPFSLQLAGFYNGGGGPTGRDTDSFMAVEDSPNYTPEAFDCGTCREQPNLLPDGTLIPCPGYVDSSIQKKMPNLLRDDLQEVWTESSLRKILNIKKKDLLSRNPECTACDLFNDCGIGCRASALMMTGDLLAKDPLACDLWKKGFKNEFKARAKVGVQENRPRENS
jgi:radical SAM protein with 4Fe4S-binding SPASM domain